MVEGKPAGSTAAKQSRRGSSRYAPHTGSRYAKEADPKWTVQQVVKPPKRVPDSVLAKAKETFFSLDRDNSGSIDAEEYAAGGGRGQTTAPPAPPRP
jgi:hypothetical protein